MAETGKEVGEGVCRRTVERFSNRFVDDDDDAADSISTEDGDTEVTTGEYSENNNLRESQAAVAVVVIRDKKTIESRNQGKRKNFLSPNGTEGPFGHTGDGTLEPIYSYENDEIESIRSYSEELPMAMSDRDYANTAEDRLALEGLFTEIEEFQEESLNPPLRRALPRPGAEYMVDMGSGGLSSWHMRRLGLRASVVLSRSMAASSESSHPSRRRSRSLPHIQGTTMAPSERVQSDTWHSPGRGAIREMVREAPVVKGVAIDTKGRLNASTQISWWKTKVSYQIFIYGYGDIVLTILIGIALVSTLAVTMTKLRSIPTMTHSEVIKQMVTKVLDEKYLSNTTSPQYLALDWIVNR